MAGATCGGRRLEQKRRLQEAAKVDYATWNANQITPPKTNKSPENNPSSRKCSSSNNHFSGGMLVFGLEIGDIGSDSLKAISHMEKPKFEFIVVGDIFLI